MAQFAASPSVYVGNLDPQVSELQLYEHFKSIGNIVSVRVCVDAQTHKSLGYGYVNFQSPQDAEAAIEQLGTSKLMSKYIRVAKVQRDPTQRRNGISNVIIKHLPATVDTPSLKELFHKYGRINSACIATDENNQSRGYAYVMFEKEESALNAVAELNGSEIDGSKIVVERYRPQHRQEQLERFTNLYVKNIRRDVNDQAFKAFFDGFGNVTSCKVRLDPSGQSMGFGFVAFSSHEEAAAAVDATNDQPSDIAEPGHVLVVRRFQGRAERNRNRERLRRERQLAFSKYPNLYVKNFDETVTSEKLKELFERYGPTISVKVMIDPVSRLSRQFGFVSVVDQATAAKCIAELNNSTFLGPKPLFVTHAVKKDVRRQALEEQQKKARRMMPYPGQMGPGMMPMFSQMVPPTMARPSPPIGMPMQPMQMRQPMMGQPMRPNVNDAVLRRPQPSSRPMPTPMQPPQQSLASVLANMSHEQQRNVLGERLYTHISREHPSAAAKVTGMLLEMEHEEILNLLDSPELLDNKIREALDVLERHGGM